MRTARTDEMTAKTSVMTRIAFMLVIAALFVVADAGAAQAYPEGLQYKNGIIITENSGSTLTDYQVLINVDTASLISAGRMNADCSDIRFYDRALSTSLPYWIESGCDSAETKIWIKVPSLAASSATIIQMLYGNPSAAGESDGNATFTVFNNFSEDPSLTRIDGSPLGHGAYYYFSITNFDLSDHRVSWDACWTEHNFTMWGSWANTGVRWDLDDTDGSGNEYCIGALESDDTDTAPGNLFQRYKEAGVPTIGKDTGYPIVEDVVYKLDSIFDTTFKLSAWRKDTGAKVVDESEMDYDTHTIKYFQPIGFSSTLGYGDCSWDSTNHRVNYHAIRGTGSGQSWHKGWIDNLRIGKYAFPEPTVNRQLNVTIDIKPGSNPNSINLRSKGVVPVAVLTTMDFDASTVDESSVKFAGASPQHWAMEDVDGDGDEDKVFHFKTQELNLNENSTEATLIGVTYDGLPLEGTDTVNIVPENNKKK